MTQASSSRTGLSRIELLVVVLIVIVVIGLLLPLFQRVRNGAYPDTLNSLKQIALACNTFHTFQKRLPPAFDEFGPMTFPASVHVHLLPYLDQDALYKAFVEADGKAKATRETIPVFLSPQDETLPQDAAGMQNYAANLRVFSEKGMNTEYDADMPPLAGIEPGRASIPRSFPHGVSNTICFATKAAVCGEGGSRYAAAPDSKFAAFFGQNAAKIPAHRSDATATFQLSPRRTDCLCTPLMAQSFAGPLLCVALMDGSARVVTAELGAQTWNLALQPNRRFELGDDWER